MIKLQITEEDIKKCRDFASKVTPETYDRTIEMIIPKVNNTFLIDLFI